MKLKIEVFKQPYTLVLHIQYPLDALKRVVHFIEEKNIMLESMMMLNDGKRETILILELLLEKQSLKENIELLTAIPGIVRLDEENVAVDKKNIIRVLSPYLRRT